MYNCNMFNRMMLLSLPLIACALSFATTIQPSARVQFERICAEMLRENKVKPEWKDPKPGWEEKVCFCESENLVSKMENPEVQFKQIVDAYEKEIITSKDGRLEKLLEFEMDLMDECLKTPDFNIRNTEKGRRQK